VLRRSPYFTTAADLLVSCDADLAALAGTIAIVSPAMLQQRLGWHEAD
jgi:hypothetical protein